VNPSPSEIARPHRSTILCVDATVLEHQGWPGGQHVLRLAAPELAARARPGAFVHIRCDGGIPMRRPLSILRAHAAEGWIEVLYKVMGQGLAALSRVDPGEQVNLLGPIGNGFSRDPARPVAVLIGGGVGVPPLVFLAERLAEGQAGNPAPGAVAFFGSELPFPFSLGTVEAALPGIPPEADATLPALERAGIPCRLASNAGLPGCFRGYVTDLARLWLAAQPGPCSGRYRAWRTSSPCRASSASRSTWPAPWGAAPAAWCPCGSTASGP
jgi:dihydroorotate dehydrogenase electron transfer subunit